MGDKSRKKIKVVLAYNRKGLQYLLNFQMMLCDISPSSSSKWESFSLNLLGHFWVRGRDLLIHHQLRGKRGTRSVGNGFLLGDHSHPFKMCLHSSIFGHRTPQRFVAWRKLTGPFSQLLAIGNPIDFT